MNRSKLLGIAMAAALSAGGLGVLNLHAGESPGSEHPNRPHWLEQVKEKLELTDDQIAQIRAELSAEKDTLKGLLLRLHQARAGVREAIRAPNASEASVRAAAAKIGMVQSDLAVERFKLYGRINPILTDEQRQKIKQFEGRIDEWIEGAINRLAARAGQR